MPPLPPIVVHFLTPEKPLYQEWDFWLVLFTFALAVMTGWLAYETRELRLDSAAAIKAAEKSASAALAAVGVSQQQLQASIQPMFRLGLTRGAEGENVFHGVSRFSITGDLVIKNAGNAPVKLKHLFVVVQLFNGERVTEQYEVELEEFQERVLMAQDEIACREMINIRKPEGNEIFGLHVHACDLGEFAEHHFFWHPTRGTRYSTKGE